MPTEATLTEKTCAKCKEIKPTSEFPIDKKMKSGYRNKCKDCIAAYYRKYSQDNSVAIKSREAIYRQSNKSKVTISADEWRQKNPNYANEYYKANSKVIRAYSKKYRQNNPEVSRASNAKRRAAKLQRTVAWANSDKIKDIYKDCVEINLAAKAAGCAEIYVVDHIVPLLGRTVSGLHVENNLQIITSTENSIKCNKFISN